ncbi:MAG: TRAP transporter small permease subunit [Proteobacteria bacterium]|nr:TRAP transporter small permease subunit [Pseudomonadota bacterium]
MIGFTYFLHKIVKWLATIALLTMMVLTFTDVNLRYWLGQPILGSNEMTEFLLGTIVFTGLVIVSGERSHVVVTLFEPFFMRKIPKLYIWLGIWTNLIGIIAVTFLITNYTQFMRTQGNETEIRGWDWWWLGTVLSVLSGFAILMAIRSINKPLENTMNDTSGGEDAKVKQGGAGHGAGGH